MKRIALAGLLVLAGIVLVGCFETTLNLGKAEDAKVDPAFCGEWTYSWQDGDTKKSAVATVLNLDGKQYFVEWKEADKKPDRYRAFVVPVKGALFAQLTRLGTDLSDKHEIMRVELKDSKLRLRQLQEKFFAGVSTDEQLRQKVEENIENEQMYDGDWMAGSLTSAP